MFRGLCSCLSLGTWVSSAKTAETIEMFLVTDMYLLNRVLDWVCTLALPGEYEWTIRARQRCGPMPNYFDHLLFMWLLLCIGWQWRNFDSYLCRLVFAAILWVNSLKCLPLWYRLNALCCQVNDHTDIFINQRIEFYMNNTITLRHSTPHIMPSYTHKMAIVSWP